jgi:hypothetical protein
MPSPFPGMDPYLEAPDIWPDLHDALAGEIRGALNQALPPPYYARLEMRPEVGIVEAGGYTRRIVPDVAVVRHPRPPIGSGPAGGVALLERPRSAVSPSVELSIASEPIRHAFVEIRDPTRGHRLVTLIEIASPSNKRPGPDREAYLRKQQEVLASDASLIELDLLRTGERLLLDIALETAMAELEPRPDYLVLVNRAWRRSGPIHFYQLFRIRLTESLPVISVPLREGQAEVTLDLQFAFNRAYDAGPYWRGAVDYTRPPQPPLAGPEAAWAEELLRAQAGQAGSPPPPETGNDQR